MTHGGLFSKDGVTIKDIQALDRFREPPNTGIMCELLWSDPIKASGRQPSKRGCGIGFGPDVAKRFLEENGLGKLFPCSIRLDRSPCIRNFRDGGEIP